MVGRYVKFTAKAGQGDALAQLMLERIDLQPLGGVGLPDRP